MLQATEIGVWQPKSWGRAMLLDIGKRHAVVKIEAREGTQTSMHYHENCRNHLTLIDGNVLVQNPESTMQVMVTGDGAYVASGIPHRLVFTRPTVAIEAYTVNRECIDDFDIHDIIRLPDDLEAEQIA